MSVKDLCSKYSLRRTAIYHYVRKVGMGLMVCAKPGQPRKLDDDSIRNLISKLRESVELNEDDFRALMKYEYKATMKRRLPRDSPLIHRRRKVLNYTTTVCRYSAQVRAHFRCQLTSQHAETEQGSSCPLS